MSLPFTSLDDTDVLGPGAVRDLETVCGEHTLIVGFTPNPEAPNPHLARATVQLEGSHDAKTWITLPEYPQRSPLVRYVRAVYIGGNGGYTDIDPNRSPPKVTATIASNVDRED